MTTLKTTLNERPATDTPFAPTSTIAASNVQEAIESAVASAAADLAAHVAAADPHPVYMTAAEVAAAYQPLDADLTSWAGVTRASGFDTFATTPSLANFGSLLTDDATGLITFMTTPSSANLASLLTDETGSGALMFGTSPSITTDIRPATHDGASLGTAALGWSDLWLATGGVITWGAASTPDMTLTHSNDALTIAGSLNAGKLVWNQTDGGGSPLLNLYGSTPAAGAYIYLSPATGTGGNSDFLGGVYCNARTSTGAESIAGTFEWNALDATNGSYDSYFLLYWVTASGLTGVTGTGNSFAPTATNSVSLGSSSLAWSDLFLASGAVIDFNAGDVTITHSADLLAIGGGSVVIGATSVPLTSGSAGAGLAVAGTTAATAGFSASRWSANGNSPAWTLAKSRGAAVGTHTIVQNGDKLGELRFEGSDGTQFIQGISILGVVDGTPGTNDMPTYLSLQTTNDGAAFPTEKLRITAAGNTQPGADNTYSLGVSGTAWSDLFLGSGAQIDWNSDVTLTHSANQMTFAGGNYLFDNSADANNYQIIEARNSSTGTSAVTGIGLISGTASAYLFQRGSGHSADPGALFLQNVVNAPLYLGVNNAQEVVLTSTAFSPSTSDGNALGTSSLMWSDLFLADAGEIDWNAGAIKLLNTGTNYLTVRSNGGRFLTQRGSSSNSWASLHDSYNSGSGGDNYAGYARLYAANADGYCDGWISQYSRGTYAAPTIVQSGDICYLIGAAFHDGTAYRTAASIRGIVDGTPGASDMPGRLEFLTTNDGASGPTTKWIINQAGTLYPGTSNTYAIGSASLPVADLFLGSGAQIDFNSDVSITHSSDSLVVSGGSLFEFSNGSTVLLTTNRTDAHGSDVAVGEHVFYGRDSASNSTYYAACVGWCALNTNGSEQGQLRFYTTQTTIGLRAYIGLGLVVGSPTGGDKGQGTINATAVYDDNTLLTDYVFDHWQDGALSPDDVENARAIAFNPEHLDIDTFTASLIERRALPAMLRRSEWTEETRFSVGELAQRLWETVEIQAVHIAKLNDRLKTLEGLH